MIDIEMTLRKLINSKKSKNIVPEHILFTELHNDIMQQVKDELNTMFAEGKIQVGETLNDKFIKL